MDTNNAVQKALGWLGLLLSFVFLVTGLGILTGLIFSEHVFFNQGIRIVVGLVLTGYGISRGISTYRQIFGVRKGAESD
ncbi:MAG: hypothetical protein V3W18_05350 [candidate division Zixibacteria bacterium]